MSQSGMQEKNLSQRAYDFTSILVEKLWSTENPSKRVKTLLRKIKDKLKVFLSNEPYNMDHIIWII